MRLRALAILSLMGTLLLRCGGPADEAPPQQNSSALDAALARHEQALAQLPNGSDIDAVLQEIAAAAERDGKIAGEDARREMIFLFPDDNIGLYLFDRARATLEPADVEALAAQMETAAPGSAGDAAAFDWRLSALAADGERLPTACTEVIDSAPDADATRRGRVALYRRAMWRRRNGRAKEAAMDLVRLYARHGEAVGQMHVAGYINSTLKEAGLLLESDLLAMAAEPARVAAALWREFAPEAAGDATEPTATGLYLRETPNVVAVEQQAAASPELLDAPMARALHMARMARIALEAIEPEEAVARYELFVKAAEAATGAANMPPEDSAHLAELLAVSNLALRNFASNGRQLRPNTEGALNRLESRTKALAQNMTRLHLQAWAKALPPDEEGAARMLQAVERAVSWCNRNEHDTVVGAWQTFLDHYDNSSQTPVVMAKLADYFQSSMKDPARAAKLYADLISKFPEAPDTEKAVMRQALALYETSSYQAALDTLAVFIEKRPGSPNVPTARYIAALSEGALGLNDEAQAHMTQLVNEFAASPIAPRALYWLGMNYITRQEYEDAMDVLRMLADRYHESEFAGRARSYIANLEKTTKPAKP